MLIYQEWKDLLFLHWKCDPHEIQNKLPPGLFVDTFEDKAYIGVIPFQMPSIQLWKTVPLGSALELNCRTYVLNAKKEPGIWFFSLDISSGVCAQFGRMLYHLPYSKAQMKFKKSNEKFHFSSHEPYEDEDNPRDLFKCEWTSRGERFHAKIGTLDYFLIERYRMYSFNKEKLFFTDVSHAPYLLENAEVTLCSHQLFLRHKMLVGNDFPMNALYSPGVNVTIGSIKECDQR